MLHEEIRIEVCKRFLELHGWIDIRSRGYSMFPYIREGDSCRFLALEKADRSACRPGDVLLFATGDGRLIGHRLHRVERAEHAYRYRLKGDTNLQYDEPIEDGQILGKLVWIRRGRRIRKASGFFAFVWSWSMVRFPILSWPLRKAALLASRKSAV